MVRIRLSNAAIRPEDMREKRRLVARSRSNPADGGKEVFLLRLTSRYHGAASPHRYQREARNVIEGDSCRLLSSQQQLQLERAGASTPIRGIA